MNPEPNAEQPRGGDPMAAKTAQHSTIQKKTLTKEQLGRNRKFEKQFPLLRGLSICCIIVVPCPLCDSWHIHGWDPEDGPEIETLRFAHCGKPGVTSYRVSVFRQADLFSIDRRAKPYGVDLPAMWKELGVEPTGDTVRFVESAPMAKVREAITYGGTPPLKPNPVK